MTRERIVRSAVLLVLDAGPEALTLAAVAARAGVSKGGLLYHFSSRESLVDEIVARAVAQMESQSREDAPSHGGFDAQIVAGVVLALISGPLPRAAIGKAIGALGCAVLNERAQSNNAGFTAMLNVAVWLSGKSDCKRTTIPDSER